MKIKHYAPIGVAVILLTGIVTTSVYGAEHALYTTSGFIDLLISKGIIPEEKVTKARELLTFVVRSEKKEEIQIEKMNADKVEVTVSQYIENGELTYNAFEDIEGLLLMVKNTTSEGLVLEAVRNCQVTYRIYDVTDTLLFDSGENEKCKVAEKVTYMLAAGKSRIFEVKHTQNEYSLSAGTYTFEIEYAGYGKGEKEITVR
jgi:hypothetical protein